MFNSSEILLRAWADYRRDAFHGWSVRRGAPFERKHFAYCLRMAWAAAKDQAAKSAGTASRRLDLIQEAGMLNNHPALVNVDHVTIMGMMDTAECERHVARLRALILPKPSAATARAEAIRAEMHDMELASDFINWQHRSALGAELAQLSA